MHSHPIAIGAAHRIIFAGTKRVSDEILLCKGGSPLYPLLSILSLKVQG